MDDNQQSNPQTNVGTPSPPVQPPAPPQQQAPPSNVPPQPSQSPVGEQQPSHPQQIEVPGPVKTNPVKKILFLAIGFLVLSALIVGGYYLFTLFTKDKTPSTPEPTPRAQSQTSTPIPTIDPMASWSSYANTKYGFSFKFPTDWTHNVGPGGGVEIEETEWSILEGPYEDVNTATSGAVRNQITVNSEETKLEFKDYLNETGSFFDSIEEEKTYPVNELSGYLFRGLLNESVDGAIVPTPAVIVILNNDNVYVKFKLKKLNPEDNTIDSLTQAKFDEILSSFEFTN